MAEFYGFYKPTSDDDETDEKPVYKPVLPKYKPVPESDKHYGMSKMCIYSYDIQLNDYLIVKTITTTGDNMVMNTHLEKIIDIKKETLHLDEHYYFKTTSGATHEISINEACNIYRPNKLHLFNP